MSGASLAKSLNQKARRRFPWFHWAWYVLGALTGGAVQMDWLQSHGWGQAYIRLPLGVLAGVVILGPLLGLIADIAKRHGLDSLVRRNAAYLLGLDRKWGRIAWVLALALVLVAGGAASYRWWLRPLMGAQKVREFYIAHSQPVERGLLTLYYLDLAQVKPKQASLASHQLIFSQAKDFPTNKERHFVLRWLGVINIPHSGTYGFGGRVDDGLVILIDGRQVAADWAESPPREVWGQISLAKGLHALDISYRQVGGGATLQLLWQTPGGVRKVLPLDNTRPLNPSTPLAEITRLRLSYGLIPWSGSTYPPYQGGRFWRVPWYGLQY
jgi:hypothetical protein